MNFENLIQSLDRFGRLLPAIVDGLSQTDARWKPADGAWLILEVVSHLADEEEFDFRVRVRLTLSDPHESWPSIDPSGWAVERRYNEGNLDEAVTRFVALRRESVKWLRTLEDPDWSAAYEHPSIGTIRAGDIFSAWAAHDVLHLRQISKRMFQLAERDAGDFSVGYAGEWTA